MLRFIDAKGLVHDAIDAATLCAAIRSADPEVWNGRFGRACLFFRDGDRERQLLVTLAPKLGYSPSFRVSNGLHVPRSELRRLL